MNASSNAARPEVRLAPVVDLLYEAAVDDDGWGAIAASVAAAFESPSAVLKTCDGPLGPQLTSVTENLKITASEQSWALHWHRNDLWVDVAAKLQQGTVFTSQCLMDEARFERSGFYQDWTRRLDVYHMVGVLFPVGQGETGVLGVHRPKTAKRFDKWDQAQLGALVPHVRRALCLHERLKKSALSRNAALSALERIETGVLLVDSDCSVLYANTAADRMLQDSRELLVRGNRFLINDSALNCRLARMVREAVLTAAGDPCAPDGAMAVQRVGRLPATILVSPWLATWAPADLARPAAMIFIRDAENSGRLPDRTLRELFELTRAEATVAMALGEGQSLEQIARSLGVGMGTVRSHLKKAMAKTGTVRQTALAVLVARSVAGISPAQ